MRTIQVISTAMTALALAGCESATAPAAGEAEVQVLIRGDEAPPSTFQAPRDGASTQRSEGGVEGEVTVRARVYVRGEGGGWVELTSGAATETVDASGREGARLLATSRLRADAYSRVRVEFERVDARVTSGLRIGGSLLGGTVRVDLGGDGAAEVERESGFTAEAGGTTHIAIDLNSDAWIREADSGSGAVAESSFRGAVRVVAASGGNGDA